MEKEIMFEKFLEKKLEKEASFDKKLEIDVKKIGILNFQKVSDVKYTRLIDEANRGITIEDTYELYCKLIYNCCEQLRNTELHKYLGIKDPYDTVTQVFSFEEIHSIGKKLAEWHESESSVTDKIKN